MTSTAVNYQKGVWEKEVKDKANEINEKLADLEAKYKLTGLRIDQDKLDEAIRHNKVEEFLKSKENDIKEYASSYTGVDSFFKDWEHFMKGISAVGSLAVNDESWHNKDAERYNQVTAIPYSRKSGLRKLNNDTSEFGQIANEAGFVQVEYIPVLPQVSEDRVMNAAPNTQAKAIYDEARRVNSGAVNAYDKSDLMQLAICVGSLREVLESIKLVLGLAGQAVVGEATSSPTMNPISAYRSWPRLALEAFGFSYAAANDIITSQSLFIEAFNKAVKATGVANLPFSFDLTKRRCWLNGNIFRKHTTEPNGKDVFYINTPKVYYWYDEANGTAVAKPLRWGTIFGNPTMLYNFIATVAAPMINGTVSPIMYGDIQKAFGTSEALAVTYLDLNYREVSVSTDEHYFLSLRNADVVCANKFDAVFSSDASVATAFDIKQGIDANMDTFIYQGTLTPGWASYLTIADLPQAWDINTTLSSLDSDMIPTSYLVAWQEVKETEDVDGDAAPLTTTSTRVHVIDHVLSDIHSDNPTPYEKLQSTRFRWCGKITQVIKPSATETTFSTTNEISTCGTELIHTVSVGLYSTTADYKSNTMHMYPVPFGVKSAQSVRNPIDLYSYFHNVYFALLTDLSFSTTPIKCFQNNSFGVELPYHMGYLPELEINPLADSTWHISINERNVPFGEWYGYNQASLTKFQFNEQNVVSFASLLSIQQGGGADFKPEK